MTTTTTERLAEQRDAFVGRLFQAILNTAELSACYLGDRLGYYRALAEGGAATSADLAARTGTHERYAREWLEQQAVAGILEVDDVTADPAARRYTLPAAHAEVMVDRDSLSYLAPMTRLASALSQALPSLLEAYRSGGGVPWSGYGEAREMQADANRPLYLKLLGSDWLPSIPDVHARLQAEPPARVADIGCGAGWSSIAIARAYPNTRVDGFDLDEPSIAAARANAAAAGLADRVSFQVRDAADPTIAGRYDLVTAFETVHDLSRPVEVLGVMRRLLADGGAVIVMDERTAETFIAPGDELERLLYGFSVLCCLATGLSEQPSAATGTVMRPATLRRYAAEAGFRRIEVLPIEHEMFRFYRLHP